MTRPPQSPETPEQRRAPAPPAAHAAQGTRSTVEHEGAGVPVVARRDGRAVRRRWRTWTRRRRWVLAATAAVLVLVVALRAALAPKPPPAAPAPAPKLTARGQVRPVAQARVGTLSGGVVASLAAAAGDAVEEQQELARVRGAGGVEVLTAPRRGTVTSVPVGVGDTVTPGTTVAVVADLSRLQVETTDVDEFLVGRLRRGQPAALVVPALDGRELHGFVRSIALQPQTAGGRDAHYPVAIDLVDPPPDLRLGMEVRITFAD